jgi:hypothetical protein
VSPINQEGKRKVQTGWRAGRSEPRQQLSTLCGTGQVAAVKSCNYSVRYEVTFTGASQIFFHYARQIIIGMIVPRPADGSWCLCHPGQGTLFADR